MTQRKDAVYMRITKAEAVVPRAPTPSQRMVAQSALPLQCTSFVGREREIEALLSLLGEPSCRLITLIGPGGIGKSRLAIEVANELLAGRRAMQFPAADGLCFVALEAVASPDGILLAIANALNCPFAGMAALREHLLAFLQGKECLLILDNFEHLQRWGDLLGSLLMAAPRLKVLVTSREALNIPQEWRYPLDGLALVRGDERDRDGEGEGEAAGEGQASAVCLFAERARRLVPTFDLARERAAVERICRKVEGIPLAIEMAAAWTRTLPCAAIADELIDDLAFLTTPVGQMAERHRTLRAVFDRSWELLDQEERRVLARLSVFRAGFQRRAAEEVAGASLAILTALIDKSLVHRVMGDEVRDETGDETGDEVGDCYRMHELLRQYAAEKLRVAGDDRVVHARHGAYSAAFSHQPSRPQAEGSPVEPLTGRELSVLALMAAGLSNREIGEQLVITQGTAKWYVSEILSKLHVRSRTQAVGRAQRLGLLR